VREHSWVQMGKCYASLGRHFEAGLALGRVPRVYPDSRLAETCAYYSTTLLGSAYDRDRTAYGLQVYLESQELFAALCPDHPKAQAVLFRLGDMRRGQKDYVAAATYYARVPESSIYFEKGSFLEGDCYWRAFLKQVEQHAATPEVEPQSDLWTKAEDRLKRFVAWAAAQPTVKPEQMAERHKRVAHARMRLADVYVHEDVRKPDAALAILDTFGRDYKGLLAKQDAAELMPRSYVLRVRALVLKDNLDGAEKALAELIAKHRTYRQTGLACRFLGDAYLTRATGLKKEKAPAAQVALANSKTAQYFNLALAINPDQSIDEYALVGGQMYKAEMYPEAVKTFQQLIERFKDDPKQKDAIWEAKDWIGKSYMAMKTPTGWQKATAQFKGLVAASPTDMDYRRSLGLCYENTADFDSAIDQWDKVDGTLRQGSRQWFEARYHLVKCYACKGDVSTGYKILATMVISHPGMGGPERRKAFEKLVEEKFDAAHRKRFRQLARNMGGGR